jgi:hypothetical protein
LTCETERQLREAGIFEMIKEPIVDADGNKVTGIVDMRVVAKLRADPERFAEGILHGLHVDVGPNRYDFRAFNGLLGKGSLQIVISGVTGRFYADIDLFNPYQDLVHFVGHSGEVIRHWWDKVWRA